MPITQCFPWSGWYKGNSATPGVMWGSSGTSLLKSVRSSRHTLKMQKQLHRTLPPLPVLHLLPCQQPERFVTGTDMPEKAGRAVEAADAKSIGYTTTTTTANALFCMTVSQEVRLLSPPPPSLTPCGARDLQPDIPHHARSVLSWPDSSSAPFCSVPLKRGKKKKKKWQHPTLFGFSAVYFSSTESLYATFPDRDQATVFGGQQTAMTPKNTSVNLAQFRYLELCWTWPSTRWKKHRDRSVEQILIQIYI